MMFARDDTLAFDDGLRIVEDYAILFSEGATVYQIEDYR